MSTGKTSSRSLFSDPGQCCEPSVLIFRVGPSFCQLRTHRLQLLNPVCRHAQNHYIQNKYKTGIQLFHSPYNYLYPQTCRV